MATLTTLRAQLRQDLHDGDAANERWANAILDRHIERVKREISVVLPRPQKNTLTTTASSRDLSITTLTDLVDVQAVEWPTGEWPPAYKQWSLWDTTLTLLVENAPSGVENVNVFWGKVHTVDGTTSTLPVYAEEALLLGAAGYAALEWASFATNRANVEGDAAFAHYRTWGQDLLRLYEKQLREYGERSRVRASRLYAPERTAPSKSTVQW